MKYLTRFATGSMILGTVAFLGLASPAYASLSTTGVCPTAGTATDCNLLITFAPDGSISTSFGPQKNYDGNDDALIGVLNNSGSTLSGFKISGSNIFGFDGDGIDTYTFSEVASNPDRTGYGGPLGYFTNISNSASSGKVNFFKSLGYSDSTYFSLEQPISVNAPPTITSRVSEPSSLLVFGLGVLGLGFLVRRRKATYKAT